MNQTGLARYLFLPPNPSRAELEHVRRMNRSALYACLLHIPLFVVVAILCDTSVVQALVFGSLLVAGPAVAYKTLDNPRVLSMIYGFTAMGLGALLVHLGQSTVQIEMHFHFFASLALLTVFGNPLVIWVAAVTVAVHHAAFWFFIPQSVFNYDAEFWVVLVHAAFVVAESIAASFIARNFFDNVIGLEKIINERTEELNQRNDDMKMILDNTSQGFLTVGRDGYMNFEKSAVVLDWFGLTPKGERFWDYLGRSNPEFGELVHFAFRDFEDEILPVEYALSQLPKQLKKEDRTFSFDYTPILDGDDNLTDLLVIISDITAELVKTRAEEQQREILDIFDILMRDKEGFVEFIDDADNLLKELSSEKTPADIVARNLHTLKGNCGAYGVMSIFHLCHEIEERFIENEQKLAAHDKEMLTFNWSQMKSKLSKFLTGSGQVIEIEEDELKEVISLLNEQESHSKVAGVLSSWRHESMKKRLLRFAGQAKGIAQRLNKGEIAVKVSDNHVRLPQDKWSPFWSVIGHVIRNAIDHGLEAPEERLEKGKPERGTLELSTEFDDKNLIIRIQDDGKGIDWNMIRDKAKLFGVEVQNQQDLEQALFHDGLSTKKESTLYSGRGVGMSAVKGICDRMGGKIEITSETGRGTVFSFKFPLDHMDDWKLSA